MLKKKTLIMNFCICATKTCKQGGKIYFHSSPLECAVGSNFNELWRG